MTEEGESDGATLQKIQIVVHGGKIEVECETDQVSFLDLSTKECSLAGTIQDTSGAVIVGAQVALVTQNGRIVTRGITDSQHDHTLQS